MNDLIVLSKDQKSINLASSKRLHADLFDLHHSNNIILIKLNRLARKLKSTLIKTEILFFITLVLKIL